MALSKVEEIDALAESLTSSADAMHVKLMAMIKAGEIDRVQAQTMLQEETILRQRANSLCVDATNCIVEGLALPQTELTGVIDEANNLMKQIKGIAVFIDLVADLVLLAAAVYAANPIPIMSALGELKKDIDQIKKPSQEG